MNRQRVTIGISGISAIPEISDITQPRARLYTRLCLYLTLVFCLPFLTTIQSNATEIALDDLYRIELIVFAHRQDFSAARDDAESWAAPTLRYPGELAFVYPPPPERAPQVLPFGAVDTDSGDHASATELSTVTPQQRDIQFTDKLQGSLEDDEASAAAAQLPEEDPLPVLMQYLPDDVFALSSVARTLKRRPEYRLLFHQSWYQALKPRKQAPWIPLAAGDEYGKHHELEGSVKLSKGRYLHITTDLWLSRFVLSGDLPGGLIGDIPMGGAATEDYLLLSPLPDAPQAPLREVDRVNPCIGLDAGNAPLQSATDSECPPPGIDEEGLPLPGEAAGDSLPDSAMALDDLGQWIIDSEPVEAIPAIDPYIAEQTVVLREYRRMRSEEVHYLDHPKFGVVVRVVPYEVEVEEE